MAIKHLRPNDAFSEGAEVWIVPDRGTSYWSRRIDWHLQFLISRSMIHKSPTLSPFLEKIIEANEIDSNVIALPKDSPLLIFSVDLLPNRETIHLPYGANFKSWMEKVQDIWQNLNQPAARIFLPQGYAFEDFSSHWTDRKKSSVSVVVDEDPTSEQ